MNGGIPFEHIRSWATKDSLSSLRSPARKQLRYFSRARCSPRHSSFAISLRKTVNVFLLLEDIAK